jgi:transposase
MEADETKAQDWRECRRKRAFELREFGWSEYAIAQALGVTQGAVSQWLSRSSGDGEPAWANKPHPGRPAKLTEPQLLMIPDMLSHGAEAWGFRGEVWTAARVALVLHWQFGVRYHKAHVTRLLKQLQWSPQMPIERAIQRDEAAIERFRLVRWPELKKTRRSRLVRSS